MENPIENYWRIRLKDLKGNLEENNFEVFFAQNIVEARTVVEEKIISEYATGNKSDTEETLTEGNDPVNDLLVLSGIQQS